MANKGIIYLAFGEEFDKLTASTANYSRQFTELPICVLTNLEKRSPFWKSVSDVSFIYMPLLSNKNRGIKVSLMEYSPYDETLFMDADSVIQKSGIESLFEYLEDLDLACQWYGQLTCEDVAVQKMFMKSTYDKLLDLLGENYPIELFSEAALLFKKTIMSQKFFALWKEYWELMGCGRDMPAFCFAVKHTMANIKIFREDVQFCTNKEKESYFIQHKGFEGFEKKFNLPNYIDWSPRL